MPEITDPTESPSRSARHPNRDNQVLARHFWRAGNAWYLPSRVPARPSRAAFSSPACSNGVWSLALAASGAERSPRQLLLLLLRSRDATGASSSPASAARGSSSAAGRPPARPPRRPSSSDTPLLQQGGRWRLLLTSL